MSDAILSTSEGLTNPIPNVEGSLPPDAIRLDASASEGDAYVALHTLIAKSHHDILHRIQSVMALSDDKTIALSEQFQTLSKNASLQSDYLNQLIDIAQTVDVGNEKVSLQEVSALLHKTFLESINCMLEISKQAMLMVYILNDGTKNLNEIEKSIRQIEVINHKTKYLSINATIEAVRAGEAGESFQVVASEVRDLSNDTQRLAVNIRGQVNQMTETLSYAQEILQKVASIDMSSNMMAKEQLDEMMDGLITNSERIAHIAAEASTSSKEFSNSTRQLVTDIQYQDRIRQDLERVSKILNSIGVLHKKIEIPYFDASNIEMLEYSLIPIEARMIHVDQGLSEMTLQQLLEEDTTPFSAGHDDKKGEDQDDDDIELF